MGPNLYLYEQLVATHHQEIQREMERSRMLAHLPRQRRTVAQLAAGRFGTLLVVLGTWLKQLEQHDEPACEPVR